jgi:hypothetical protein
MSKSNNTDMGFFLKIACLFFLLGLGFVNPKHYLNQSQEVGVKQLSLVQKPNTVNAHLVNHAVQVIK